MADRFRRPLIAVTGPVAGGRTARVFTDIAVRLAGGRCVQVTAVRASPPSWVGGYVIGGGSDVHPALYGGEPRPGRRYDRERDAFELGIIEEAVRSGRPLLGICRGAQLINVYFGGTLHPALRELRRNTSNLPSPLPVKWLHLSPGSALAGIAGRPRLRINSLHRQGVDRVGAGLAVTGVDNDRLVQAIEAPAAAFCLGVQWHPEYLLYLGAQRRLFEHLVASARAGRAMPE